MSAEEGRDYEHLWPSGCLDGGEHDPYEVMTFRSYLPQHAYCARCRKVSLVVSLLPLNAQ